MTMRIKRASLSWLLVFAMMVGLMPAIGGGVYAEELPTDNLQGYEIESVQIENTSVDVEFTTESDALLFAAVYDQNGKQIMVASDRITADQTTATLTFKNTVSEEDTIKVFMLDAETQEPLCEERIWKVIQITIDPVEYENTIVNRTITGTVTDDSYVESLSYSIKATNHDTTEQLEMNNNTFSADVLLEDGENIFTVTALTKDGAEFSESVTLFYDSGHSYFEQEDYPYNNYFEDENLVIIPVYADENETEPCQYLISNFLNLYFREDTTDDERRSFITEELDSTVVGYLSAYSMIQVKLKEPITESDCLTVDELCGLVESIAENFSEYNALEDVELEYIYCLDDSVDTMDSWNLNPNLYTKDLANMWWIKRIDADEAWEYDNYNGLDYILGTSVGIVEPEGFDYNHQDLYENLTVIKNKDKIGAHGTHTAGIITATADNTVGLCGILHNKKGCNGKVLGYAFKSSAIKDIPIVDNYITNSEVKESIKALVESGAKIINCSFGKSQNIRNLPFGLQGVDLYGIDGYSFSKSMGLLLAKGFDFIVVQSAGNGNEKGIGINYKYNGLFCSVNKNNCYEKTMGGKREVSKSDIMNRILVVSNIMNIDSADSPGNNYLSPTSNGGKGDLNIIAAPGTNIFSCVPYNRYEIHSGTSMAAPIVTGVCALTWSVNTELTGSEVVNLIMGNTEGVARTFDPEETGIDYSSKTEGGMGIVNALKSVEAAIETIPTYQGHVQDTMTGNGLSNVNVKIHKGDANGSVVWDDREINTNENGDFLLPTLPKGTYTLELTKNEYATVYREIHTELSPLNTCISLDTINMTPSDMANTDGLGQITFRPFAKCTCAEFVTFLWRAFGCPEPTSTTNPFTDVEADAYYYKAVLWAAENGTTTFSPDANCTSAQMATFLWCAFGCPEPTLTTSPFVDVEADAYYYKAVLWAAENGICRGATSIEFWPDATHTRSECLLILSRAFGYSEPTLTTNPFTDVEADYWFYKDALWAVEKGIITGTNG